MKKRLYFILICLPIFAFITKDKNSSWKRQLKKEFSLVTSGNVVLEGKISTVQSFYIKKGEITNKQYRYFLDDLKATNRMDEYVKFYPDTMQWENTFKTQFSNKYTEYYFCHPAYLNYPVVNVSYESVQAYCLWYSEKINKNLEEKDKLTFRLPTREEFIRACRGDNHDNKYSWKGDSIHDNKGNFLCNHTHYNYQYAGSLQDENTDIIAPIESYWPNQFGVYNLNGNVAEMISEKGKAVGGSWRNGGKDVKNESVLIYDKPLPNVGFRIVATKISKGK